MKVVYVAAPYRAETHNEVYHNIQAARLLAEQVWALGAAAICPNMNTAFMSGVTDEENFLIGGLELVKRCDALVYSSNNRISSGVKAELDLDDAWGCLVFDLSIEDELYDFKNWLGT